MVRYIFKNWLINGITDINRSVNVNVTGNVEAIAIFNPTIYIFDDGFESGLIPWTGINNTAGETVTVTSTLKRTGAYAGLFTSNGRGGFENARVYKNLPSSYSQLYVRASVYVSQNGIGTVDNNRFFFIRLRSTNNDLAYAGWKITNGVLRWDLLTRNGTAWKDTYSLVAPLINTWYDIKLFWLSNSVNGQAALWVNNMLYCITANQDTATLGKANQLLFGLTDIVNCGGVIKVYGDDVYVSESDI